MKIRGEYQHTRAEERAHVLTHGLGALLALVGLVVLLLHAVKTADPWRIVAAWIYGASLILLYLISTLYHGLPPSRAKNVFRALDHSAIYLLIAGTYTPFTLVPLRGAWGWSLFGVIWGLAVLGIVQEALLRRRFRGVSLGLYLLMGWIVVIAARPLAASLPTGCLLLLAAGGAAYSGGIYFYLSRRVPYHHAIWHLFVLAGSACHYLAVLRYVL
ncbi:MAG TPA: hemolysin III family protein [Candidatus Krumholzibacteria bacterium]|nr:hemolysin III family protein [Candidatus Krumholzibacteria bacterium]